jgi:hypothetical protein
MLIAGSLLLLLYLSFSYLVTSAYTDLVENQQTHILVGIWPLSFHSINLLQQLRFQAILYLYYMV